MAMTTAAMTLPASICSSTYDSRVAKAVRRSPRRNAERASAVLLADSVPAGSSMRAASSKWPSASAVRPWNDAEYARVCSAQCSSVGGPPARKRWARAETAASTCAKPPMPSSVPDAARPR